ncbi:MAG: AI-2E family transporter, partial [Phycisphaerales bacterium JB041]
MADTPDAEQTPGTPSEPRQPRGDWKSLHLWQIQGVRDVLVVLGVLGLLWLGQKISIVTVPLLLAILFAYLFEPVIRWLMKRSNMKRQGAVTAVLAATILAIIVPSALGLTFGIIQSAGLVKDLARNTGITLAAVTEGAKLRDARAELARLEQPDPAPAGATEGIEDAAGQDPSADQRTAPPAGQAADAGANAQAAELEALKEEINTLEAEYQTRLDKTSDDAGPTYRWIADFLNEN